MTHQGTKRLETDRLILRRFTLEDTQAAFDNWESSSEVTKYLVWQPYTEVEGTRACLERWIAQYEKPDFYQWAIQLKDEDCGPIGTISVVDHDDRAEKASIGYCIGTQWWGRGVMTEALKRVIAFLFDEVGLQRVDSSHDPRNPASGAVMRKAGMHYEATLRRFGWNNQGICDESIYAIFRDER